MTKKIEAIGVVRPFRVVQILVVIATLSQTQGKQSHMDFKVNQ